MHNRLWIAAIVATTPILALSPAAFPASHSPGCVKPMLGSRYNERLMLSLMRRKDALASRTLAVYNVERVKAKDVKPINPPVAMKGAQGFFELPQGWLCEVAA